MFKIRMELVEWSDKLTKRRMIRVGIVDTVEGLTLIGREIEIGLDKRLEQGHTLWFDLGRFDFEELCGYTRYCCIRRDQDHEEIEHLLHMGLFLRGELDSLHLRIHIVGQQGDVEKRELEAVVDMERLMKLGKRVRMDECRRLVDIEEVEAVLQTSSEVD